MFLPEYLWCLPECTSIQSIIITRQSYTLLLMLILMKGIYLYLIFRFFSLLFFCCYNFKLYIYIESTTSLVVLVGQKALVPWTLYMISNSYQELFQLYWMIRKCGIKYYWRAWSWENEGWPAWKESVVMISKTKPYIQILFWSTALLIIFLGIFPGLSFFWFSP